MKRIVVIFLLFILIFIGYRYIKDDIFPLQKQSIQEDNSPIVINPSQYSPEDKKFLTFLQKSCDETNGIVKKLETEVEQAQEDDELPEAQDAMQEARKNLLFQWNQVHNGYAPQNAMLKRAKGKYEAILSDLRDGLEMELDGMEQGVPEKMKEGFQRTTQAKSDFQTFAKLLTSP